MEKLSENNELTVLKIIIELVKLGLISENQASSMFVKILKC